MVNTTDVRARSEAYRLAVADMVTAASDPGGFGPAPGELADRATSTAFTSAQDVPRLADQVDDLAEALRKIRDLAYRANPADPGAARDAFAAIMDRVDRAVSGG